MLSVAAGDLYNLQHVPHVACRNTRLYKELNLSVDGKKPPRTILLSSVVNTVTASVVSVPPLRTLCDRLCLQLHEKDGHD